MNTAEMTAEEFFWGACVPRETVRRSGPQNIIRWQSVPDLRREDSVQIFHGCAGVQDKTLSKSQKEHKRERGGGKKQAGKFEAGGPFSTSAGSARPRVRVRRLEERRGKVRGEHSSIKDDHTTVQKRGLREQGGVSQTNSPRSQRLSWGKQP